MSRVSYVIVVSLLAVLVAVAGCSQPAAPATTAPKPAATTAAPAATSAAPAVKAPAGDPILIGFQTELTSAAAVVASSTQTGALLAVDEINAAGGVLGRPLKLLLEDNQGKADQSALIAQKHADQKVVALTGTILSADALAVVPVAQAAKIPFLVSAASTKLSVPTQPYVFQVSVNDNEIANAWLGYAKKLGAKKIGGYYTNLGWGIDANTAVSNAAGNFGLQMAASVGVASAATDATVQVGQLKSAGVEAIIAPAYVNESTVLFNALNALGWKVPVIGTMSFMSPNKAAMNGSYWSVFADLSRPDIQALNARAVAKYGQASFDPWMGNMLQSYDSIKLLAWAINKANSVDGSAVNNALETVKDYQSVLGKAGSTITFSANDHMGLTADYVPFATIQNGEIVVAK